MINRRRTILVAAAALAGLLLAGWGLAQSPGDPLAEGFRQPPDSAKPRTWWHWTNGNVTKEGITKDLEWMKRTGIGGFQLADVASGSGQTVPKKILFGTPEWLDAVRHASAEAQRLGPGNVDLQLARLERGGRPVGEAAGGHEAAGLERNGCGRPAAFHGQAGAAAIE